MAKKNIISVNWEDQEGGKFITKAGEYIVKVIAAEQDTDDEDRDFIKFSVKVVEGKEKGATIGFRNYLTPKTLWRFRELLEAVKYDVGNSVQDIDLDEIIDQGTPFVISVEEGNERPDGKGYYMQVVDYMPLDDYEEAAPVKKVEEAPKKSTKAKDIEEVDEEEIKAPEVDESEAIDAMEEEIDELDLDIDLDDYKTFAEKKKAFEKAKAEALQAKEDDSNMVGDTKYTKEDIEMMGTSEIKKVAAENGIDMDLDLSTRGKRRLLMEGLKAKGLLDA